MNMRIATASILGLAMIGCAGNGGKQHAMDAELQASESHRCATSGPRAPARKVININYQPDPMVAAPESICARPGDMLWFKFTGNPNADLKVESKVGGVNWLRGGGKQQWFYVLIPWDLDAEDEQVFRYKVILGNDEKVLDPEVRVKNNYN